MGVGPSTKETSLHHFRDPLLDIISNDTDVELVGIIVQGTPQDNKMKALCAERTAAWLEAMRVDGVILSSDGWGNSDVDFAYCFDAMGRRNIPAVGLSFVGTIAQFVVTNQYMEHIVDINKSSCGTETEVVGENNVSALDCKKALAMLKLKLKNTRSI